MVLDFELEKITPKKGGKNSNDSLTLEFCRRRETQLVYKDENGKEIVVDLITAIGKLWKEKVRITFARNQDKEGVFNGTLEFIGRVENNSCKAFKTGDVQYLHITGDFNKDFFMQVGHYLWIDLESEIEVIQPDLNSQIDPEDLD